MLNAPWRLNGYNLSAQSNSNPDMSVFSESEREQLKNGFTKSRAMNFTARTAATHGPDWQKAQGGLMRYEDMLDPQHQSKKIVRYIQETAPHLKL